MNWDKWPAIKACALELAYDNGMVNRTTTEEQWLEMVWPCMEQDGVDHADLLILEDFCDSLSDRDKVNLVAGEFQDAERIAARCKKPHLVKLFDEIFDAG